MTQAAACRVVLIFHQVVFQMVLIKIVFTSHHILSHFRHVEAINPHAPVFVYSVPQSLVGTESFVSVGQSVCCILLLIPCTTSHFSFYQFFF